MTNPANLPDSWRIRLIPLPAGVGEQIREYPDGHIDIFVNANWGADAQRDAVEHALEHWRNDDFHSDEDIRQVEARADRRDAAPARPARRPIRRDMSGRRMDAPAPVFSLFDLERVGSGIYLPTGRNLEKARRDIAALRQPMDEAALTCDVMQRPPLMPRDVIAECFARLGESRISFIGWPSRDGTAPATSAVMHLEAEDAEATLYYSADGAVDAVHARLNLRHDGRVFALLVTLARQRARLRVWAILRAFEDGEVEMIYGG